jgi:hypothetical protein
MRFLMMIRASSDQEAVPSAALMQAMHEMARGEVAAGRMIADGGLAPVAAGKRLAVRGRKVVALDGPFAETKEVIGGFAVFELPDMAAAVESARRFLDLHVQHMPGWEGTMEIREVAGSQVEMIKGGG